MLRSSAAVVSYRRQEDTILSLQQKCKPFLKKVVSIFTVLFLWFDSFFFPCSITRSSPLQHPPCLRGYVSVTAERQPQQTAESYRTAFRARYCLRFAAMASLTPGNTL